MSDFKLPSDESEQLLIKSQDATSPEHGCAPQKRSVKDLLNYGVINLDKPRGPTSHEVVSWVRKILGIEIAGHGGTLDPRVTGVLPCGLGKATRALSALLTAGKEYVGVAFFHEVDPEKKKWETKLEKIFKMFTGKIYQRPPLVSAVARNIRTREIYYSEIIEVRENHVLFRVGCEAGTYIRKLCFDIGEALCSGAHMAELRRTRVGPFREEDNLISLQNLKDAFDIYQLEGEEKYLKKIIFPMEKMVEHMPKIFVRDTAIDALCHGANLASAGVVYIDARIKEGDMIAYMSLKKELVGFGTANKTAMQIYKAKAGLVAKTSRIFMERGVYPHWSEKKAKEIKE